MKKKINNITFFALKKGLIPYSHNATSLAKSLDFFTPFKKIEHIIEQNKKLETRIEKSNLTLIGELKSNKLEILNTIDTLFENGKYTECQERCACIINALLSQKKLDEEMTLFLAETYLIKGQSLFGSQKEENEALKCFSEVIKLQPNTKIAEIAKKHKKSIEVERGIGVSLKVTWGR